MPSDLKQRIQAATLKSLTARNRYNDQVTAQLTQALKQAEDEVYDGLYHTLRYINPERFH